LEADVKRLEEDWPMMLGVGRRSVLMWASRWALEGVAVSAVEVLSQAMVLEGEQELQRLTWGMSRPQVLGLLWV